jgi:hypothetical protein
MKSKSLPAMRAIALVLPLACSAAGAPGDDRLFVPEDLPNTLQTGQEGVTLKLFASTLVQGPTSAALYVAVRNDGSTPYCNSGVVVDFIDKNGQTVAEVGAGLQSKHLYELDPATVLNCIDPGDVVMAAAPNLPAEVVIDQLSGLTHKFPAFGVDGIVPLGSFTVSQVHAVAKGAASAYQGVFTNPLSVTATGPGVTIFPLNRVGRPLGAATSSATIDVPPDGSWSFETTTVNDLGVDYAAYPSASVSN